MSSRMNIYNTIQRWIITTVGLLILLQVAASFNIEGNDEFGRKYLSGTKNGSVGITDGESPSFYGYSMDLTPGKE